MPNHNTLSSRSRSSAPVERGAVRRGEELLAIAAFSSSDHSRRSGATPPVGSIRSIHSTSGRHIGHESVSIGGYSIEPVSIAASTAARAVAGSVRVSRWSGSSIRVPILSARSSSGSGTMNASFTTVPRLWSTYTSADSASPDGNTTPSR